MSYSPSHDSHFRPSPAAPAPGTSVAPPGFEPAVTVATGTLATPGPQLPRSAPSPAGMDDPRLSWTVALIGIAFAFGMVIAASVLFAIALAAGANEDSHGFNFIANLIQDALIVAAAVLAVRTVVERPTAETFGLRRFRPSAIGWVVLGLVGFLVLAAVYNAIVHVPDTDNKVEESLGGPLTVLFALAIAPPVEELFFRGFLYRCFRNGLGVVWAAIVSGLIFGAIHVGSAPGAALPLLAALGVILALVYQKTNSLWPCIMLHATYNALVLVASG